MIVRWIVLGADHGDAMHHQSDQNAHVLVVEAPNLRIGVLGHGCLGSERDVFAAETFDPAPHHLPGPRVAEACVVGEGAVAQEAVRRLVALGAQTHATAATVEEHAAVLGEGASPRRAEDLAALMPRLGIVVSTGRSNFIDARLIARLPEGALIVDFAGPPGSVDFETAKRLGCDVIWARKFASAETEAHLWTMIRARVEAIAMTRRAL